MVLARFGGDLLSHVLRRSTIGATALNGRVRNGAGCFARAVTTKPRKNHCCAMVLPRFERVVSFRRKPITRDPHLGMPGAACFKSTVVQVGTSICVYAFDQ